MARSIAELLEAGAASTVIGRSPEDYRPLLYLPPYLYHQRIRAAEVRLANHLRLLLEADGAAASAREIAVAIVDVCDRPHWIGVQKISLSAEQSNAVRTAALHRLAIISGGPGPARLRSCSRSYACLCGSESRRAKSPWRRRPAKPPIGWARVFVMDLRKCESLRRRICN